MRSQGTLQVAILLIALSGAYGVFQARNLLSGPQLTVHTPLSGQTLSGSLMMIEGTAENMTEVRLNGRPIATDLSGNFKELLAAPLGIGEVEVEARDRFGRTVQERLLVYGDPTKSNVP